MKMFRRVNLEVLYKCSSCLIYVLPDNNIWYIIFTVTCL